MVLTLDTNDPTQLGLVSWEKIVSLYCRPSVIRYSLL